MSKDKSIDRVRKLQTEIDALRNDAKQELLDTIQVHIKELETMGLSYRLVSGGSRGTGTRQRNPERPCPVCKFSTTPPHDARSHRGQDTKKAFTAAELRELDMTKR